MCCHLFRTCSSLLLFLPQAVAEKEAVEEFMRNGKDLFGKQAASVEDIGKAGQDARQMVDGLSQIAQVIQQGPAPTRITNMYALRCLAMPGHSLQHSEQYVAGMHAIARCDCAVPLLELLFSDMPMGAS